MNDSILTYVKKMHGIDETCTDFDVDLITHINTVLMILTQMGVGPTTGFSIVDKNAVWSDFLSDSTILEGVKSYIYLKVRLIFDTPTNTTVITSINSTIKELEWRIYSTVDNPIITEEVQGSV